MFRPNPAIIRFSSKGYQRFESIPCPNTTLRSYIHLWIILELRTRCRYRSVWSCGRLSPTERLLQ